jgi:NTP pyrophosphatase (non-canonical NTP hydrolase)
VTYEDLTFRRVSAVNAKRAARWHRGFPNHEDGWTGADWSNAMCGEAGEAANIVKKIRRIDISIQQAEQKNHPDEAYMAMLRQKLATEIGDTFIYLDLLAQFYGLKMEKCVAETFNRVSDREGFPEKIV